MSEEDILEPSLKDTNFAKCPGCGNNLEYNPNTQTLYCEHCEYSKPITDEKSGEENSFEKLLSNNEIWNKQTHVYRCANCGSITTLLKTEISTKCPYCGTSKVVEVDENSGLKPTSVITFTYDKDKAALCITSWYKKKLYAPRKFKSKIDLNDLTGIYNPVFTYDSNTITTYSGRLGKYYYTTHRSGNRTVTTRHTRWFKIKGVYNYFFDDYLVQASDQITQKSINALQPFNTNNCLDYKDEYLLGFTANHYTKDGIVCWNEAKKGMDVTVKSKILARYNYDVVGSYKQTVTHNNITYKYLLLPIYIGYTIWKDKNWNFYVNGINGKVTGKVPVSGLKVLLTIGIILVVIALFVLLAYLGG